MKNTVCLLFGLLIFQFSCSATAERTTQDVLAEINWKLDEENKHLRQEIAKLSQLRDVEADIAEIKKVLESYGEDLTALRIQQGYLVESVDEHDKTLLDLTTQVTIHSDKLSQHDTSITENHVGIESHTQTLNEHGTNIQWAIDSINANVAAIQQHQGSITANSQNIQAVTDNYNNYRNSQVKFFVDTVCCGGLEKWPDNTRITFPNRYLDTHGAFADGQQFHAPFAGIYTFIFTADFRIYDERPEFASILVSVNEGRFREYLFDSMNNDELYQSYSISFTIFLNPGDRVDVSTLNDPCFDISRNPATFLGYMLQPS